jgi:hypothetical protein
MTRYEYMTQEYQRLASQQGDVLQVRQLTQQLLGMRTALVGGLSPMPHAPSPRTHLHTRLFISICERINLGILTPRRIATPLC